jgi:hypothetical protein
MKNKYVKLLTATALSSVMSTGIAMSQLKISGYQETGFITGSTKGATESAKTLGTETGLRFDIAGKLNNGMDYAMILDTNNFSVQSRLLTIGSGNFEVYAGAEAIKGIELTRTINPYVNNRQSDITNGTGLSDALDGTSSENFVGFDVKNIAGNGRFSVTYTPNTDQVGRVAAGTTLTNSVQTTDLAGTTANYTKTDGATSAITVGYVMDITPQIRIGVGVLKGDSKTGANDDADSKTAGIRFAQGPFAVGYQYHKNENHTAIATSQTNKVNTVSATYAVTKDLSVGVAHSIQDRTLEAASVAVAQPDLKQTAFQVGYSLGAVVLQGDYMKASQVNHVAGADHSVVKAKAKVNF